jgi:carbon storage regulator
MLILSRKPGEEVVIDDNIILTVVAIRGNQVRLGFTAPSNVSIQRQELCPSAEKPEAVPMSPTTKEAEQ